MTILRPASTQYNHMTGTVAVDWHDGGLHDFAEHCGVDIDRFFPLAATITVAVVTSAREPFLLMTFYAADRSVVGKSADAINAYALEHDGRVPTKQFHGEATLREFAGFAKRFEVVLAPTKQKHIREIEYEPE